MCHQRFDDSTHGCKKLVSKTRSLSLIPSVRVFDVGGGGRPEDRWLYLGRERIRRRTWSQGISSGPELSRSSSRRSSSSRWALVSGIVPGVSLTLSHNCSIRRRRSSGVRSSMFSAGLLINPNMPWFPHHYLSAIPLATAQAEKPRPASVESGSAGLSQGVR